MLLYSVTETVDIASRL